MKDLLADILASRGRAWGEMQKFTEEARSRATDGKLAAEDQQEWERRSADLDDYDSRINQLKERIASDDKVDEYREGLEKVLRPNVDPAREAQANEEQRFKDFVQGKLPRDENGKSSIDVSFRGLHVEQQGYSKVVRDTESRVLSDGSLAAGAATYGPTFREVLYQHLIWNSAIRQTRATVLTTDSGEPLLLPKTTAHPASATIVAEGGTIGSAEPTFAQGTLSAYKYPNLIQVSTELTQDTAVDLLGYLAMAMGRALGNGSGVHFITGTGTSQPQGVLVGAGTTTTITGGTPASNGATFSELERVYDNIIPPYQLNAEWLMSQTALSKIRSLTNTQGTPIFLPSLSGAQPDTLFGKPIRLDPNMPAVAANGTSIAFGDFSPYFIRDVQGVRFERSLEYAFGNDLVSYRAVLRTDGRLLDTTGAIATYKCGTA